MYCRPFTFHGASRFGWRLLSKITCGSVYLATLAEILSWCWVLNTFKAAYRDTNMIKMSISLLTSMFSNVDWWFIALVRGTCMTCFSYNNEFAGLAFVSSILTDNHLIRLLRGPVLLRVCKWWRSTQVRLGWTDIPSQCVCVSDVCVVTSAPS